MKITTFIVLLIIAAVAFWFYRENSEDSQARKEAVIVKAKVVKLRCKRRLKGDKSLLILQFQGQEYSIYLSEEICNRYQLQQPVDAYYSKTFNKMFLD